MKSKLTRSQRNILGFIAERSVLDGAARHTKKEIADAVGVSLKTVDRAIVKLRSEGLIEAIERRDDSGAQLSNEYRIARMSS